MPSPFAAIRLKIKKVTHGHAEDDATVEALNEIDATLESMEAQMSELTDAIAALVEAASGLTEKVNGAVKDALADFQLEDEAEDAAFRDRIGALETENSDAAAQIRALVEQINAALPGDDEVPVPEPLPDEPHPDQTLPGDLPPEGQ